MPCCVLPASQPLLLIHPPPFPPHLLPQSIAKFLQEGEAGFGSFVEPELGQ